MNKPNLKSQLPTGISAQRVAAGRNDAKRWQLYKGLPLYENWIGDLVHWETEGEWEFQPSEPIRLIANRDLAPVLAEIGRVTA